MKQQDHSTNGIGVCSVIPPYIFENIVKNGNEEQRRMALRTLEQDSQLRAARALKAVQKRTDKRRSLTATPHKNRLIHNAGNYTDLPGTLVRSEGQASNGDVATDEAYNGFGATFDLFWEVFNRNSIDGNGMDMLASVHYDYSYNNAFWDGTQMVFGDGDGYIFNRFTIAIDVMGHELTHGVTEHTAGLEYHDQPGALNESISDVFGSLVKQRSLNQTADQADWLIGAGLIAEGRNGVALRSMKAPGTAYDDWLMGKDPQPDHMSKYDTTTSDNGGVHINSGIPNKAFYLTAVGIGGKAWEKAGQIWFHTLTDPRLSSTAQFLDFANLTVDVAGKLYDDAIQAVVAKAWKDVGINVVIPELPLQQISVVNNKDGRLEVFRLASDKALYHNWQLTAGSENWSGWKPLGGKLRQFTVAQNKDGRLEVIGVDAKNENVYSNRQLTASADKWSGWKSIDGTPGQSTGGPKSKKQQAEIHTGVGNVLSHELQPGSN